MHLIFFLLSTFTIFSLFRGNSEIVNVVCKNEFSFPVIEVCIFFFKMLRKKWPDYNLARSKHVDILVLRKVVVFGGHLLISFSPF